MLRYCSDDYNRKQYWLTIVGIIMLVIGGTGCSSTHQSQEFSISSQTDIDRFCEEYDMDANAADVPLIKLKGHTGGLVSVSFSPDSKKVVTTSHDRTARIWDADTGVEIHKLGHQGFVFSAAFSPDSKKIVTGSDDKYVRIWDVDTGKGILRFDGLTNYIHSVAFSTDGKKIATTIGIAALSVNINDTTARIWDAGSGKELLQLKGHAGLITSVVFSPDRKTIATTSYDSTIRLWDVSSGKEIRKWKAYEGGVGGCVASCDFCPDGKRIVTTGYMPSNSYARITVKIWDVDSGKELLKLLELGLTDEDLTDEGHTDIVFTAVFSPNGKKIATASADSTARIWDAESGKELLKLDGHESTVVSVAISPDGKKIATASADIVRIWDFTK